MALDVYLRQELADSLAGIGAAMFSAAAAHGYGNVMYCRGIYDTLRAQAVLYGLSWPEIEDHLRRILANRGVQQLLDDAVTNSLAFSP